MPELLEKRRVDEEPIKYQIGVPLLTVCIFKDNNRFCAKCLELDLVTEMDTIEEVAEEILSEIKEYAKEYTEDVNLYSSSPNRAHHLPYIKAIVSCKNDWDLRMLLEVRYGSIHI
ncbi:MAG: hypothetical protein QME07_01485 [bacterium]|nr:hypothetical protein [bacterium]